MEKGILLTITDSAQTPGREYLRVETKAEKGFLGQLITKVGFIQFAKGDAKLAMEAIKEDKAAIVWGVKNTRTNLYTPKLVDPADLVDGEEAQAEGVTTDEKTLEHKA